MVMMASHQTSFRLRNHDLPILISPYGHLKLSLI